MKKLTLLLILLLTPLFTYGQITGIIQITGVVQNTLDLNVSSLVYRLNLTGAQNEEIGVFSLKTNMNGAATIVFSTQNGFALKSAEENPDEWKYTLVLVDEKGLSYIINNTNEIYVPSLRKGGTFSLRISYLSAIQLNLFQGTYTDNLIITFKIN